MKEARRLPFEKGREIIHGLLAQGKEKDAMIFLIGLSTGLRTGDMTRVTWEHLRVPEFKLIEQKTRNTRKVPKPVTIHVPSSVRQAVTTISQRPDGSLKTGVILVNRQGKPMSRINIYDRIQKACAHFVNDRNYSGHSLRKGFGYHFYKSHPYPQVALQKLSERFNHSNQRVTLRYLGLDQEEIRDIIEINFNFELEF
jgi:integrase